MIGLRENLFLISILKAKDFLGTHSSYWNRDANCTYYNLTVML